MKKTILTTAILTSLVVSATTFNVIITKDQNEYKSDGFNDVVTYSEWVFTEQKNCETNDTTTPDELYYDRELEKDFFCDDEYKRDIITTRTYHEDNSKEVISKVPEYKLEDNESTKTETIIGTHLETKCSTILSNGYSIGNDIYPISPDGNEPFDVFCDMTTDGGGWTLIQGGTINNTTSDDEFINYYTDYLNYVDDEIFYLLDYDNRHKIPFREFKTLHSGETSTYTNIAVLDADSYTSFDANDLVNVGITSYKTSFSMNGNQNINAHTNCNFTSLYRGHIDCDEGTESQNPWYQTSKIQKFGNNEYGIHTCMRFIVENGDNLSSCSERELSAALYDGDCNNDSLGDLHWQNKVTRNTCNYRSNPAAFYKWQEWVR